MPDAQSIEAEPAVQQMFSRVGFVAGALALLLAVAAAAHHLRHNPNRAELGPRRTDLRVAPVQVDLPASARIRVAGAWKVTSDDSRVGGVSALAIDGGTLVAMTDSGVVIRFGKPPGWSSATVNELPAGPGSPNIKANRDAEALARTPTGWWVAFENRNEVWQYDRGFGRALTRVPLGAHGFGQNRGVEAMVAAGGDLLLFPEGGGRLLRLRGGKVAEVPLAGSSATISDAAPGSDGRLFAVERRFTPLGFRNALLTMVEHRDGYRVTSRTPLGLGLLDNVEGLAVEPRKGGGQRLWLMTDDNLQPPLRTLLIAIDVPAAPAPPRG